MLNGQAVMALGVLYVLYKRKYVNSDEELDRFKAVVYRLTKDDVLTDFDTEFEIADQLSVEHAEHGHLDLTDINFIGFDELVAIGPRFVERVRFRCSEIMEQAAAAGLSNAMNVLKQLPIESWKWTGLSTNFVFDAAAQSRVVKLLKQADDEIKITNNYDGAQAKAFIKAALILAESPQPQPDLVWEIIQRVSAIVGLLSGIETLISIFKPVK